MAKFCCKCGMKLNEETGKCPNCDEKTKKHISSSDGDNSTNVNPRMMKVLKKPVENKKAAKKEERRLKK